jgi:hypothetical protein
MSDIPVNLRKTRSIRLLGMIDLGTLVQDILAIPQAVWELEDQAKPNRFQALDNTQHIVFRFVSSLQDWRESYDRPLWAEWRQRLEPILDRATREYGYRNGAFPRIMLAKMAPGGVIHPHIDAARSARWPHKIHVPITTNEKVAFYIEPNHYHLSVGHAYEVNNTAVHAVQNAGDTARIHLIFEYYDTEQDPTERLPETLRE